jgi:hypothetical protein
MFMKKAAQGRSDLFVSEDGYRDPGATPARRRLTKQKLAVTIRVPTAPGETSKARNTDDADFSEDEA